MQYKMVNIRKNVLSTTIQSVLGDMKYNAQGNNMNREAYISTCEQSET